MKTAGKSMKKISDAGKSMKKISNAGKSMKKISDAGKKDLKILLRKEKADLLTLLRTRLCMLS